MNKLNSYQLTYLYQAWPWPNSQLQPHLMNQLTVWIFNSLLIIVMSVLSLILGRKHCSSGRESERKKERARTMLITWKRESRNKRKAVNENQPAADDVLALPLCCGILAPTLLTCPKTLVQEDIDVLLKLSLTSSSTIIESTFRP
jgi:hypothetical protein